MTDIVEKYRKYLEEQEARSLQDVVPLDRMFRDTTYARPLSDLAVKRIVAKFSTDKLGTIMVSHRPDRQGHDFAIIDGNHRVEAARLYGLTAVPCRIWVDLTIEEEAELFEAFNTIKHPTSLDRFRSRLVRKEPVALDILRILEEEGMHLPVTSGPDRRSVRAVSALDRIYAVGGPNMLRSIIQMVQTIWGFEKSAWTTDILHGFCTFWVRYGSRVDRHRLVRVMSQYNPGRLQNEARTNAALNASAEPGNNIGRLMAILYNKGLRSNGKSYLPAWQEYRGVAAAKTMAKQAAG